MSDGDQGWLQEGWERWEEPLPKASSDVTTCIPHIPSIPCIPHISRIYNIPCNPCIPLIPGVPRDPHTMPGCSHSPWKKRKDGKKEKGREGKLTRVCLVKAVVGSKWHQEGCPGAGRRGMMLRTRKDAQYWEGCSGSGRMFRSRKDRMDPHFQEGRSVPGRMLRSRKDRTDTQHQEGSSTLLPQPGCLRVPQAGAGTTSLAGFPLP